MLVLLKNQLNYLEEKYNRLLRVSDFWSNNYIEYESNGDRNKKLSIEEYLYKL